MSVKNMQFLKEPERIDQYDDNLSLVQKFYSFLVKEKRLKPKTAFSIIYYLQEHLPVIPDTIEKCEECETLFDSDAEGYYSEKTGKNFCYMCDDGQE